MKTFLMNTILDSGFPNPEQDIDFAICLTEKKNTKILEIHEPNDMVKRRMIDLFIVRVIVL